MHLSIIALLLILAQSLCAKTTYPDGNYSEAGGEPRMCMRCHMDVLNPVGVGLAMSANQLTIASGGQVNVTVVKSNFKSTWKPGIAIHFSSRIPQDYGWEVVNSPHGNPYNFIRLTDPERAVSNFTWVLKAPKKPGLYSIAASAYFNDGDSVNANDGTKRGDNALAVTVTRVSENIKPQLLAVSSLYKIYVFLKFSEPMDSAAAATLSNYAIVNASTQASLAVLRAFISRDGTVVTLQTAPHQPGAGYSITVSNLKDYAATPNTMDIAAKNYTPDLATSYKIYAEFSQDVTASRIEQYDEVENLGKDSLGNINRVNLLWAVPNSPVDLLPGISFVRAVVRLSQKISPRGTAPAQNWQVWQLFPGGNWWEYFGNNVGIDTNFSGYNPGPQPIAVTSHAVTQVDSGIPTVSWAWDITQSFRARYQSPGGSGTNQNDYFLRLKAENETTTSGAGFFGADAPTPAQAPYIELMLDSSNIASERLPGSPSRMISIFPNPCRATAFITLPMSENPAGIVIYDMAGKAVCHQRAAGGDRAEIGIGRLPPGIYLVKVDSGKSRLSKRMIVIR